MDESPFAGDPALALLCSLIGPSDCDTRPDARVRALAHGLGGQGQAKGQEQGQAKGQPHQTTEQGWDRLVWLAVDRHRTAPLIADRLTAWAGDLGAPADAIAAVDRAAKLNATKALGQIAETARLARAMAPVDPLIFKGWPLSERLYGGPARRHTGDIDMAVAPSQIAAACALLDTLGYRPDPGAARLLDCRASPALAAEGKDLMFAHPSGHVLELHWHLLPYRGWPDIRALPGAVVRQTSQAGSLGVLSDQANMLYLPAHGGLHLWTRLKWLADLVPLAQARGPDGLAEDLALARKIGLDRPLTLGLRLAARLLGAPLPTGMALGSPCRRERIYLDAIGRDDMIPVVSQRYRFWTRLNALALARGPRQILGVLRYDTVRRVRLGLAKPVAPKS